MMAREKKAHAFVIELNRVGRQFGSGPSVNALVDVDLCLEPGEWLAITGPSGAGKSTLLHILGCLDRPTSGEYYFEGINTAALSDEEKEQRRMLFGSFADGFRPIRPYRWGFEAGSSGGGLIEIPVTTMPFLRLPFHFSYLEHIASISIFLALSYFKWALALCALTRIQPSLLLHPLDFLGEDDLDALAFFPAMELRSETKLRTVRQALSFLSDRYRVLTVKEHVTSCGQWSEPMHAVRSFGASRAA